jgi:hypothetical protein
MMPHSRGETERGPGLDARSVWSQGKASRAIASRAGGARIAAGTSCVAGSAMADPAIAAFVTSS